MIENHWMDKLLKEVLMIDELSIVETDKVNHTVEMDMLKLVVEVECFGKCVDEFDKVTVLFGEMQLKQEDRSYVHASNELHLHVVHVVLSKLEADQHWCSYEVFDQLNIRNEFAPYTRKSVQKLGINLKLL
ncbi:hypothetical protein Tco_0973829 [Tanacetum coccineum]|uniref:Uncharacterized protein n=1 Tax=Tanacetum coccineum TaxID=301880 RepID=A0ABQ5E9X8_9ASTR